MSRRPTVKGKSMSQELANRMGVNPQARAKFTGRKEYERKEKPTPKGLGRC